MKVTLDGVGKVFTSSAQLKRASIHAVYHIVSCASSEMGIGGQSKTSSLAKYDSRAFSLGRE